MQDVTDHEQGQTTGPGDPKPLGPLEVLGSTFLAAFGVQTRAMQRRDFTRGNVLQFIAAGVLFTAAFVVGLLWVVRVVSSA